MTSRTSSGDDVFTWTGPNNFSPPLLGSAGYVELDFKRPVMIHDMGVTENYAILPEVIMDG
jgi:hypothetical protein